MNIIKSVSIVVALGLLGGCATIVKGTSQVVSLDTPGVPGAECVLNSSSIGTKKVVTPANISLDKGSDNITVRCTKRCYQPGNGVIASNLEGMAAGNIIAGGPIGLGIDAATGAMNKYTNNNQIMMTKIPGCR